jgi:hypothetical protein
MQLLMMTVPDSEPLKVAVAAGALEDTPPLDLPPVPPPALAALFGEHAARPTTRAAATRRAGRVRCENAMN